MNIDIKHKHAGHLINIKGHPFLANDAGMWNLTEIWQTLKLPKTKAPGRWRGKEKDRLSQSQNLDVQNKGRTGFKVEASKRATIEYAAWVSPEFKDMVFDAFEAVLEMPEVAKVVADKMRQLGYHYSAGQLEREKDNYREAMKAIRRTPESTTPAAIANRQRKAKAINQGRKIRANRTWEER